MDKYYHLWNELPASERKRLMTHMIESQILHLEQGKRKAQEAHRKLMKDFNDRINNCRKALLKGGE